jgi:crotonobetainyl-CoA:carnitine CoA-transferase CaiB-like acyl-CoA transferase
VNYRPGVAVELGLDYASVRDRNPGAVYAAITAFGRQGPYRDWPGFDLLSQAAAGIMAYENRIEDGVPTGVRTIAPADLTTGMFTAYAVVSALYQRAQTGRGQEVQTSLFGSGIGIQYRPIVSIEQVDGPERAAFLAAVEGARESGLPYEQIARLKGDILGRSAAANYYRVYQTQDSLVAVACLNNRLRRNLRDLLGVADPTVDGAAYDSRRLPPEHHLAVRREMEARFKTRTTAAWLEALEAADVPAAPFLMTEELYDNPHVLANDLIPTYEHAMLGPVRQARMPVEMSEARVGSPLPSPALGSHTEEVLVRMGLSMAEIERLEAGGVIARWQPSQR